MRAIATTAMLAPLLVATAGTSVAGAAPVGSFSLDWSQTFSGHVADSSPVLVDNGGDPFVAVASKAGWVRALDLDSGAVKWAKTGLPQVRAPLSSDGSSVFVPTAQNGKNEYPAYRKFLSNGAQAWNSNPTVSSTATGFLLSGLSLARINGQWRGFGGSSGHHVYGVNGANGQQLWKFQNADSTMATPAIANLFGTSEPQVITSNDTSREFPGDRNGGILRIFTPDGEQICSDIQLADGDTYKSSGYNNSSPAVAEIGGEPLIVFGSTGPVQTGAGANQILGYNATCTRRWASPALAGRAETSPVFADVLGRGTPQVVQLVARKAGAATYPQIYVIDPSNGEILADTGGALSPYGANIAYPQSISVATADFNEDGAQDMIVPAKQGQFLVLDGKTQTVLRTIPTNLVVQNTPIVTETPNGLRVTFAGYNGFGGTVSSYTVTGGELGAIGWHAFGNDAQLTRSQGSFDGPYNQLLEGQTLQPGEAIHSTSGGWVAEMEPNGNFTVRDQGGQLRWQSATSVPGSHLLVAEHGELQVRSPTGAHLWSSGTSHPGVTRLVFSSSGVLTLTSGVPQATRQLNVQTTLWTSAWSQIEPAAGFVPITPCRVVDTRQTGDRLGPGATRSWRVRGAGGCGIPSTARAVEATITAVRPNGAGFFRAWPSNAPQPNATFLNYTDQGISNSGAITLGSATNDLSVKNYGGAADFVIDVQGYFVEPTPSTDVFVPTVPCRIVDTRNAVGSLAPGATRSWKVRGGGGGFGPQGGSSGGCGIPSGATAVEATVSAVTPSGDGFFRAWPTGEAAPQATFLNYSNGRGISNTGAISIGAGPTELTVRNFSGRAHYVVDVQGYFIDPADVPVGETGSLYVPGVPCRVVDTRSGGGALTTASREWQVRGSGPAFSAQGGVSSGCSIPPDATSVESTVAAVGPTRTGFFRAWPSDAAPPNATYLNFVSARSISNTGSVGLGGDVLDLSARNYGGSTHYVVDIQGAYVPVEG